MTGPFVMKSVKIIYTIMIINLLINKVFGQVEFQPTSVREKYKRNNNSPHQFKLAW